MPTHAIPTRLLSHDHVIFEANIPQVRVAVARAVRKRASSSECPHTGHALCGPDTALAAAATLDTTNTSSAPDDNATEGERFQEQSQDLSAQDPELAALLARSCSSGKWMITRFATTPPMSTYIVAWANGEFEYRETRVALPVSGKEVPLRIYGEQGIFG